MARLYRITVEGILRNRWASALDAFALEHEQGRTVLVGVCRDSSALYGRPGPGEGAGR